MSKKANPTLVGAFVLIGLCLALAAVIIIGKIRFKDNVFRAVAYFTGSLYGLDIGAPVTFRGVVIGRVSAIRISYDQAEKNYVIPVYFDIVQIPGLNSSQSKDWDPQAVRSTLSQLINQGLRAQLKVTSLLTSKLYIDLAFYPGSEPRLHSRENEQFEIPTQLSGLEQITQKLESLPLEEILNKTASALDGINKLINSKETGHALQSLDATLDRLNTLLGHADAELPGLLADLKKGLTNVAGLAASADTFLRNADKALGPNSHELQQLLANLSASSLALTKTLNNIDQLTAKDSNLSYQAESSLREIEKAASSLRQLTDYLQQNPNALVFGQGKDAQ